MLNNCRIAENDPKLSRASEQDSTASASEHSLQYEEAIETWCWPTELAFDSIQLQHRTAPPHRPQACGPALLCSLLSFSFSLSCIKISQARAMGIILHDLVGQKGLNQPLFSPNTTRARLCLLHKGVSFETKEITYHDLRFGGWKERLGVQKATGEPSDVGCSLL